MSVNAWTQAQLALLKNNPGMPGALLARLLAEVGPPRTANSIDSKRTALRIKGRKTSTAVQYMRQSGWPVVPPPEAADRTFLTALLIAGRAEGVFGRGAP